MDWQQRMNRALDYLEESLDGEIDWEAAAARASCSPFHFRRMFEVASGVSPADYVLRRRAKTASRLSYREPAANTPPLRVRLEARGAMTLTGLKRRITVEDGRQVRDIPAFWLQSQASGALEVLESLVPAGSDMGVVGVSVHIATEWQEFNYLIAIEAPQDRRALPTGCVDVRIEPSTWAKFDCSGPLPSSMTDTIRRAYGEWFTTSGYEHAGGPEIEIYPPGDKRERSYRCELWMPVVEVGTPQRT